MVACDKLDQYAKLTRIVSVVLSLELLSDFCYQFSVPIPNAYVVKKLSVLKHSFLV